MNFRDYQFQPRILPTAAAGLTLPLLIGLGVWQLDRAAEKETLAADLERLRQLPPLELNAADADTPIPAHRQLAVTGVFEPERQIYLENRRQGNRVGYQVITPLRLEGSELRLMVNRGWVPAEGRQPPPAPAPSAEVRVEGLTTKPQPPAVALGDPSAWGRSWPYFTLEDYAVRETIPLLPVLLLQSPESPHGFLRNWPRERPNPMMHLGYAIQWFAFALIAAVIYLRLSFERKESRSA
jgi:surfeit locus 1 family protein